MMPRNILSKRRFSRDDPKLVSDKAAVNQRHDLEATFQQHGRHQESDEERASSECSSDSGRESAAPGDSLLSPSLSFERPSHLDFRANTVSSSSSSENLQPHPDIQILKSPSSPYPLGHISLLPRILENLVVSNNHHGIKIAHHPEVTTSPKHLPPFSSCFDVSTVTCAANVHHHPTINGDTTARQNFTSPSTLSPASRKRANSIGNNNNETSAPNTATSRPTNPKQRKTKNGRRLAIDDVTSSPVSGTIIRTDDDLVDDVIVIRRGDLDKTTNVVEITEEAKNELAKIENKIGEYSCKLCKLSFDDAFALASHNCSRIVHIEYQCPECGKTFHCPANLASHRRWHKPKSKSAPSTPKGTKKLAPVELPGCEVVEDLSVPRSTTETDILSIIPQSHMPFKKRFLFTKGCEKNDPVANNRYSISGETARMPTPQKNVAESYPVSADHYQCQLCQSIIQGAQEFARHWQSCIFAASQTWTSVFCKPPRFA